MTLNEYDLRYEITLINAFVSRKLCKIQGHGSDSLYMHKMIKQLYQSFAPHANVFFKTALVLCLRDCSTSVKMRGFLTL